MINGLQIGRLLRRTRRDLPFAGFDGEFFGTDLRAAVAAGNGQPEGAIDIGGFDGITFFQPGIEPPKNRFDGVLCFGRSGDGNGITPRIENNLQLLFDLGQMAVVTAE